jgi:hypothetical protein
LEFIASGRVLLPLEGAFHEGARLSFFEPLVPRISHALEYSRKPCKCMAISHFASGGNSTAPQNFAGSVMTIVMIFVIFGGLFVVSRLL